MSAQQTDEQTLVVDCGDLKKYRTELPNLLDDSSLSPRAVRLYLRYKRVAGDKGACWQSIRTLAKTIPGMSVGSVVSARDELVSKKWVKLGTVNIDGEVKPAVFIVDVWGVNFQKYAKRSIVEQCVQNDVQNDVQLLNYKKELGKKELKEEGANANASRATANRTAEVIIAEYQANPAYKRINVRVEFNKMLAWCNVNNKRATEKRLVNWLNKIEQPLDASHAGGRTGAPAKKSMKAQMLEEQQRRD